MKRLKDNVLDQASGGVVNKYSKIINNTTVEQLKQAPDMDVTAGDLQVGGTILVGTSGSRSKTQSRTRSEDDTTIIRERKISIF